MQWSNDIFDVYKDQESEIRTLITSTSNIEDIEMKFSKVIHDAYQYKHFNGFDRKEVKKYLTILSLAVFSRARVALHRWKSLSKKTEEGFQLQAYTREQLIGDMEKKENSLMALQYHVQLMETLL
jgi:anthranilate/para-aminobenzoate synthase component II